MCDYSLYILFNMHGNVLLCACLILYSVGSNAVGDEGAIALADIYSQSEPELKDTEVSNYSAFMQT